MKTGYHPFVILRRTRTIIGTEFDIIFQKKASTKKGVIQIGCGLLNVSEVNKTDGKQKHIFTHVVPSGTQDVSVKQVISTLSKRGI